MWALPNGYEVTDSHALVRYWLSGLGFTHFTNHVSATKAGQLMKKVCNEG